MRIVALILIALLSWSAHAQPETIAYWAQNDNALPNGGFGFTPDSFPQPADSGALAGSAFITLGNFNQTTSGVDSAYECLPSFGGTTVNALPDISAGGSLSPQGCSDLSNNGMHIDISLSTVGYEDIVISWAQRGTGSGFFSRQLSWSADGGGSFTDFGSDTGALGTAFVVQSYDLASITEINDNAEVILRITLDGATGASGNNRYDNILVEGNSQGGSPPPGQADIPYQLQFSTDPYSVGWSVQDITGAPNWNWSSTNNNVSFSSFSGSCIPSESWFISPEFDLDGQTGEQIFIDIARGFVGDDPLDLLVSTDYTGSGDPNQSSWTLIRSVQASEFSANNTPVTFGPFDDLQNLAGTAHVAARGLFETGNCSTWRISRFQIAVDDGGPGEFACVADPADDGLVTRIHAIQGDGFTSPLAGAPGQAGELVEVQAVVVGSFQDTAAGQVGGFFLQELDANTDTDPLTSEGIYISRVQAGIGVPEVAIGQELRVAGAVRESFGQTEIFQLSNIALCSEGRLAEVSPASLSLPVADLIELEAVEGMWVRMPQALAVNDVFSAARFAEFTVAPERLFQPTQVVLPGSDANALQAQNDLSRLIIDQGFSGSYVTPFQPGLDGSPLKASNPIRAGYRLQPDFEGVMGFGFSNYRLLALQPAQFDDSESPRQGPPELPAGNLRAASFNVENLFSTIQTGGVLCGPGTLTCRGATSESELARQLIKVTEALLGLNADVVGLVEIENDDDDATLAFLVDALNALDPVPDWTFVPTGFKGTDAIKNAIIYRAGKLSPIGQTAILDGAVDISPPFNDSRQRPVLTQAFSHVDGGSLVLSVVHLRSKNCGSNASGANLDQGDGQACWNALRTESMQSWSNWIAGDPTGTGSDRHLVMGDFNAYGLEDPMRLLMDAGYVNQAMRFNDDDPAVYSYIFQGQSGSLDHVLASPSLDALVLGAANWAINADEIPAFAYPEILPNSSLAKPADFFAEDPFRSSDHDPLLMSLMIAPDPAAQVQLVHLAPFAAGADAEVDVRVDGELLLGNFAYADSSSYVEIPAGSRLVEIMPAGQMAAVLSATVELASSQFYSVVVSGDDANQDLTLSLLEDAYSLADPNSFALRLGHLAPFAAGSAAAEVRLADGGLVQALNFGEIGAFVELPAGAYDLVLTAPGGEPVLLDLAPIQFTSGTRVSVFAAGDVENQPLAVYAIAPGEAGDFLDLKAAVLIDELLQTYTGAGIEVSVTTEPVDLAVEVRYDGLNALPVAAGEYLVEVEVVEPGFAGSATAVLVIEAAEAGIELVELEQLFTGAGLTPGVITDPAGLAVELRFDGSSDAPVQLGSYIVEAQIVDPNYFGSGQAIFRIVASDAQVLSLAQQPGPQHLAGAVLSPALVVELLNGAGEPVTQDNETVVEVRLLIESAAGVRSASLPFASTTVVNGVAVFDALIISQTGSNYRLLVQDSDESLAPVITEPFSIVGDTILQDRFEQQ